MEFVIETNTEKVKGSELDNIKIFKGIPYAEPPVNNLRLNVPEPILRFNSYTIIYLF